MFIHDYFCCCLTSFVKALSDYEALEKSFGEFHNRYFKLKEGSEAYKKVCTYVCMCMNTILLPI